jgi:hypothetical protein
VRVEIEHMGYTIIANMGDQPSDFRGGHAEKNFYYLIRARAYFRALS